MNQHFGQTLMDLSESCDQVKVTVKYVYNRNNRFDRGGFDRIPEEVGDLPYRSPITPEKW